MKTLLGSGVPNIDTSDPTNFPKGDLKNKLEGVQSGTPLNRTVLGDILQGMYEIIRRAGITFSETDEKKGDSQIADAIEFLKPVAIIRAGYDSTADAVALFGGKYIDGYSATFVESNTSGTTTVLCKLSIKKDGVVSTEKFFASVSSGMIQAGIVSAKHNFDSDGSDYYFDNDSAGNINYYDPAGSDIANVREVTQFVIKIYKIAD